MVTVDVDAAARAVMAAEGLTPYTASALDQMRCRSVAEAVLALVAEEQADLHAVVDAAREVDDWLQGNGAALGCAPRLHAALAQVTGADQ